MQDFYDINIIPKILKNFNVETIVISGIKDDNLIKSIFEYGAKVTQINTNYEECIKDNPLNALPNLGYYDAIFINDDSNWYTVFNELKIIKGTNEVFPLVFICNNNFPNKRRDSYSNPDNIPSNFRQEYINGFPICYNNEKIIISDGFFHACDDNTPRNGVLTAIEDFLKENLHIGIIEFNFLNEICILYPKLQINQKRISIITKNIQEDKIEGINLSDKLIENKLLLSYIDEYNLYNENLNNLKVEMSRKDSIIDDYENKVRSQNNELLLKDSQINGFESHLSLKDSKIKNIESKLVNKNIQINDLESQLELINNDLDILNQEVDVKSIRINNLESQLENVNNNLNSLTREITDKNSKINDLTNDFKQRESNYNNQINFLNNEISQRDQNLKINENKYFEQIKIKDNEIISIRDNFAIKEDNLNSKIKIQQIELDDKKRRIDSLEHSYTTHLSKIDQNEYCIDCFKEEISNNCLEIKYLKNNTLIKKVLSPLAYAYLIIKSNPKEILLNIKLYDALKNSKCFDIGFYLNNNKDLIESKWCKYFSPELHYVCTGFSEDRTFNKKYFNRNSKKDLLEYLLTCGE